MFNEFETKIRPEDNWELKYIHIFKGIYISPSENEYKKGNRMVLSGENEFSLEEKKSEDIQFFVLHIKSKSYHVLIRSNSRISLEYIIFHSTLKDDKDTGRPLTFYPHLSNIDSPLEEKRLNENNYRGFINLIIIALVLSHFRLMWENYVKYGLLLTPANILQFATQHENILFVSACIGIMSASIIITYLLQLAQKRLSPIFILLHILNLAFLLSAPIYLHKFSIIHPLTGVFMLSLVTICFLKLYSYIHFWNDVRIFIKNKARLIKSDAISKELQSDLYKEIEEVIENYPGNIYFKDLIRFLSLPVLCFQYKYPTTQRIRKSALLNYGLQFLVCILLMIFISWQYILPTVKNSMKFIKNDDYLNIIERILKLAIPNVYSWIIMFYAFFHSWLNLLAELTYFGDRNFYRDWWNSLYLDEYWRTWNLPTHYWLIRHVYNPLRRRKVDKLTSSALVFFVSAIFHEYVISGALGYINYWAFIAMFANWPISVLQEFLKKFKSLNKQSQMLNVQFWVSFCFFGQPLCVMLYFYNYYKRFELPIPNQ